MFHHSIPRRRPLSVGIVALVTALGAPIALAAALDLNLHVGWERHNLFELNTVTVPYAHRSGNCRDNCGDEGGSGPDDSNWLPIWWGPGSGQARVRRGRLPRLRQLQLGLPRQLRGMDRSDRVHVVGNRIGPYVAGEHIDVKEGTEGGVIRGNTFDGRGISGQNSADS